MGCLLISGDSRLAIQGFMAASFLELVQTRLCTPDRVQTGTLFRCSQSVQLWEEAFKLFVFPPMFILIVRSSELCFFCHLP